MENQETPALEDGIYFDLDEKIYHAQERLSASGICKMMISPPTFWAQSWLNPDRDEIDWDTPARILGRAYHTARFEPDQLLQRFVPEINPDDYENIITSGTEIGDMLAILGEPKKKSGEKVIDQARRLEAAGYTGAILHLKQEIWEAELHGRTPVKPQYWDQLQRDMKLLDKSPEVKKHLTGGFAEVSVLWTDERTGIQMKCRFDYLRVTSFTDFKTYDNSQGKHVEQCIIDQFRYNRYYIQAKLYHEVTELIRKGKIGRVQGEASKAQRTLIDEIAARKVPLECWYVFQEKSGIPNLFAREVHLLTPVHESHPHNDAGVSHETSEEVGQRTRRMSALGKLAASEIETAKNQFVGYSDTYKPGEPWLTQLPTGSINDDCFSPYWLGLEN